MATKSKHPDAEARATDAEEMEGGVTDDPKFGTEYYLLDNGLPMAIPDNPTLVHPMEIPLNPAAASAFPAHHVDDSIPLSTSIRSGELMMLPDAPQEERVAQYNAQRDALIESMNEQIATAQDAIAALEEVQDPPEPPEPEQLPEEQTELSMLPTAAVESEEERSVREEPEPGFPPPDEKE